MQELDVRSLPPAERHPLIRETFAAMDAGETLALINDHDPKPLYYEFAAEVDGFDADAYRVEQVGADEYHARLPKV